MKTRLLYLAVLLITVSCSKQENLQEPVTLSTTDANAQGANMQRSAVAKATYVTSNVNAGIYSKNTICVDKYGIVYFKKQNMLMKTDSIKGTPVPLFTLANDDAYNFGSIAATGDGYIYYTTLNSFYCYTEGGVMVQDFTSKLKTLAGTPNITIYNLSIGSGDNVFVSFTSQMNPENGLIAKITSAGKVSLLATVNINFKGGGLFKAKGSTLYATGSLWSYMTSPSFSIIQTDTKEEVSYTPGISYASLGAGIDNTNIYAISGNSIWRINPNTQNTVKVADIPTSVNVDGRMVAVGTPNLIAPSPDAKVFYVHYSGSWQYMSDQNLLLKVTL